MILLDHVKRCNAFNPADYRPFEAAGRRIGSIRHDLAERLAAFPDVFLVRPDRVDLARSLADPAARTAAVDAVARRLAASGHCPPPLGEAYRVVGRWGEDPLFLIDRAFVPAFGITAFGVHLNGYVREGGRFKIWIAERSADRRVEPNKLDNMVAGGQPAGLGLMDNLIKESHEEAGLPAELARQAVPAGAVGYCMASEWGLKPDWMFVYDLAMPAGVIPVNRDGEVSRFTLMEPADILALLRDGWHFKFNVPLVLIDFLIRHGFLSPDSEPDYLDLIQGLRRHP